MPTFYSNLGETASLRSDQSTTANRVFDQRLGTPRHHIRVGEFACVVGIVDMFVGEQYGGDVPKQNHPTDRRHREWLLQVVEANITKKNPMYKRVMAAIARERELYMPQWHAFTPFGKISIPARPTASIDEARRAYLRAVGRQRLAPNVTIARL